MAYHWNVRKLRPEYLAPDLSETALADADILVRDWPDDDEDEEDDDKVHDDDDDDTEGDEDGYSE